MNPIRKKLPPDRSHIRTEQRNPGSMRLHAMSVRQIVGLIRDEDQKVLLAMERAAEPLARLIEAAEPKFNAGGRLIYFGAGTSGRLGVLDASEAPPTFRVPPDCVMGFIAGGDVALRRSSEGAEDDADGAKPEIDSLRLSEHDIVIGIAAGGTTPYVHGALRYAKLVCSQCLTGLLICAPITHPIYADHLVLLETGPEILTGSTRMKAGTATKLALNTISTTLMIRSARIYQNLLVDMAVTNDKLRDRAARTVSTLTGLTREQAFDLLDAAGLQIKVAVVMHRLNLPRQEAQWRLQAAAGRLHEVIGE